MIKKTITYKNFNEETTTEDLYFNLNAVELTDMKDTIENGLGKSLDDIIDGLDPLKTIKLLNFILVKAYGEKSEDGKYFKKTPEIESNFACSEACQAVLFDMIDHPDQLIGLFKQMLPANFRDKIEFKQIEAKIEAARQSQKA